RLPDGNVAAGVLPLLKDPNPEIRIAAADLIDRLAPPDAGEPVNEALVRERDPEVAAALLNLCRRWPVGASREVILAWLDTPGPARQSAVDALGAFADRALLSRPEDRARVVRACRDIGVGNLSPAGLRLLCDLGGDADRSGVVRALTTGAPAQQIRAAEALA